MEKEEVLKEFINSLMRFVNSDFTGLSEPDEAVYKSVRSSAQNLLWEISYLRNAIAGENYQRACDLFDFNSRMISAKQELFEKEGVSNATNS